MKFPKIKFVTAVGKYKLRVAFSDSTEGEYDISHLAGRGVFKIWDLADTFYKVSINPDSGAISWPGDLDIDTINIYCQIKGVDVDEYLSSNQPHAAH